jgi:glycosyltransferase involved in cell wall biosynthesis
LPVLYAASTVVIYPSLFEGFGLPVVEALACGAPVITSNTSSLPEVGGDAALLVDPLSIDSIADAIARLWSDETTRAQMSRRGVLHAANYSWERTARETAEVYERVLA